jgi:hypothetical protein
MSLPNVFLTLFSEYVNPSCREGQVVAKLGFHTIRDSLNCKKAEKMPHKRSSLSLDYIIPTGNSYTSLNYIVLCLPILYARNYGYSVLVSSLTINFLLSTEIEIPKPDNNKGFISSS